MTIKEYLRDGSLAGSVVVTECIDGERPIVRTSHTWFHPQGGGQKGDRGKIGDAAILDVRHAVGGDVDHYVSSLSGLTAGNEYPFVVDVDWRRTNAIYHSAGHLLAAAFEEMFPGLKAINGHQWPGEARVEFSGECLTEAIQELNSVSARIEEIVQSGAPILVQGDPFSDRSIKIGDFAAIPCGGTHARSTTELGVIRIRTAKIKGGLLRVSYEVDLGKEPNRGLDGEEINT